MKITDEQKKLMKQHNVPTMKYLQVIGFNSPFLYVLSQLWFTLPVTIPIVWLTYIFSSGNFSPTSLDTLFMLVIYTGLSNYIIGSAWVQAFSGRKQ